MTLTFNFSYASATLVIMAVAAYLFRNYQTKTAKMIHHSICILAFAVGIFLLGFTGWLLDGDIYLMTQTADYMSDDFVEWILLSYERFFMIAMVIAFLSLVVAFMSSRLPQSKRLPILSSPSRIIVAMQGFLVAVTIVYTLNTINAYFNVGAYISLISVACILLMFIGFIIAPKDKKKV